MHYITITCNAKFVAYTLIRSRQPPFSEDSSISRWPSIFDHIWKVALNCGWNYPPKTEDRVGVFESLRAYLYRYNASTTGYAKESLINELSFVCVDLKSYVHYSIFVIHVQRWHFRCSISCRTGHKSKQSVELLKR